MQDLSFARKYRPNTLTGYIGNDKLKKTAMASLKGEKRPQAILLSGDSGCGKTTFARLLAKEYLCEDRDSETGACGCCFNCQAIDDYIQTGDTSNLGNVMEVDIANQNGKRDVDSVIEDMRIPSLGDQWKVYILDEVHMATQQAQNNMLKIVEEPPENVLIIFCTTDPDRLIDTLRNRCQLKLRVKKPKVAELGSLLKNVCAVEGVDCDTKGVNFIANRAGLTIRQALQYLEQVINEEGDCTYESAIAVFEEISDELIIDFCRKLFGTFDSDGNPTQRDVLGCVSLLHQIKMQSDLNSFVNELTAFVTRGIYVINQIKLDGVSDAELVIYRDLFSEFTVEQISVLINKLMTLNDGRGNLESKLLSLCYTGLQTNFTASTGDNILRVPPLANEITKETKASDGARLTMLKKNEERGISEASQLNRPAELSDIEALFGNVSVKLD